jgi:hypothetical protein
MTPIRDSILKLLRSPGIDSKESIPPAYVAWRPVPIPIWLVPNLPSRLSRETQRKLANSSCPMGSGSSHRFSPEFSWLTIFCSPWAEPIRLNFILKRQLHTCVPTCLHLYIQKKSSSARIYRLSFREKKTETLVFHY